MVLTSTDVSNFKSVYSVIVIHINCDAAAAEDKSLPRNSYLIKCDNGTEVWYDIVMGFTVDIFNAYYDKYGNVMKGMTWTAGSVIPKLWGYTAKDDTKQKK